MFKKIDIFIFRIICVFFSFLFYLKYDLGGYFISFDYTDYTYVESWISPILLISGFLSPYIYFSKNKKVNNKLTILYEIIFLYIYIELFNILTRLISEYYYIYIIGGLQVTFCYCVISWFLLSYYNFDGEE